LQGVEHAQDRQRILAETTAVPGRDYGLKAYSEDTDPFHSRSETIPLATAAEA
jgi:hypothetical protein